MKKLKEKLISLICVILFFIYFKNFNYRIAKQENMNNTKSINYKKVMTKEAFFNCTGARDTVFVNGDYLKYISIDIDHYDIEIKINQILDTFDLCLGCKTYSGMIPKVLFRTDSGCLILGQGSSSYRYMTLCTLNKKTKKININRFETAIDVSSEKDGFFFIKENNLFLYEVNKKIFFSKKLLNDDKSVLSKEFVLYNNRVSIINKNGNIKSYFLNDFKLRNSMLCNPLSSK